jgi:hypothetical protein
MNGKKQIHDNKSGYKYKTYKYQTEDFDDSPIKTEEMEKPDDLSETLTLTHMLKNKKEELEKSEESLRKIMKN